jgi:gliding motility-associated-like protein
MSCRKSSNNSYTPSALADSLRKNCTHPFVGEGDSSNIYLPTAFTPNGNGLNDVYRVVGRELFPTSFSNFLLTVYDTTGRLMFRSTDPSEGWEGYDSVTHKVSIKYKFYVELAYNMISGKSASAGTFVYLLPTDSLAGCVEFKATDSSTYIFESQFDATIPGFNTSWPSYETYCN